MKQLRMFQNHLEMNGQCKCFNQTLITTFGTLNTANKARWREYVPTLVLAYNCTKSNTNDCNPYYLMCGQKPHLPIDLYFGTENPDLCGKSHSHSVKLLRDRLEWSYGKGQGMRSQMV